MRRIILFMLLLFVSTSSYAYKEHYMLSKKYTPETLKPLLVMNQKWVKYPAYSDREGWNKLMGDQKKGYIKAGEIALKYNWQHIKASDYLEFERSGDRNIMQNKYNANNSAIAALFLAEMAEGEGRFINQLIDGVYFCCEMTSWVMSAHVKQRAKRALPDEKYPYIDLGAGYTGAMLAWVYYYLEPEFEKVIPTINQRLHKELKERIMDTYMENDSFFWMAKGAGASRMVNNWNPWCNLNSLLVFALLEDDPQKLSEAVYKTMASVDKYINYTKEDGACEEGPSYWNHAAGKLFDYLSVLLQLTDGKVSVFDEPMIKRLGEYIANSYVGNGWVVNFADASAKGGVDPIHVFNFGQAVGSDRMMSFAKMIAKNTNVPISVDMFKIFEELSVVDQFKSYNKQYVPAEYTWYPQTEFCYMTNPKGYFYAGKGGYNNESHNHNDVGSFSLYVDSTPIIIDAGVGTYTRQTFSGERYKIWSMQSNYHNLPIVNGVAQRNGAQFKATDASFNSDKQIFKLNIAKAYPAAAKVNSWTRESVLTDKGLKLTDKFDINGATKPNQMNFLSWGDIDASKDGMVVITVDGVKCKLEYDAKQFDLNVETVELDDRAFTRVWGDKVYRLSFNAKQCKDRGKYEFSFCKM